MKTKPFIVIIITLVIGFLLGMLTSAQLRYHRLKPVKVFFSEEKFREGFYRAIQPDQEQKAKIDLILDKYARINGELQNNFRKEFDESMKEFRKEIDSNLSKEQLVRLKALDERRHEMIRQNRKHHRGDSLKFGNEWSYHRHPGQDVDDPRTSPSTPSAEKDSTGVIR